MKIQDLLNQAKQCWKYAAMDERGTWYAYTNRPYPSHGELWIISEGDLVLLGYQEKLEDLFGIEPVTIDWKDSLIVRGEE